MSVRDITTGHRSLSESTLMQMKKTELVKYIRVLEHNWSVAVDFNERQARNFADMLHNMTQFGSECDAKCGRGYR